MKLGEIEDCDQCPLNGNECPGGMTSGPGGNPIEPPCTSWDPNEEADDFYDNMLSSQLAHEEMISRNIEKAKEEKIKAEIKKKRAYESRLHVRVETRRIKSIRKQISALQRLNSFASAMVSVNSMMHIENDNPVKVKSKLELEIDALQKEVDKLQLIKKEKLKEFRKRRKQNEKTI